MKIFKALFELMDFLFDVEEVLKSFINGRVKGGEFEEYVSFLEICGSIVKFKVVDRENVVGDEIVDKCEHIGRMRS